MTFEQFRRSGYVSKLSEIRCGGGPTASQVNLGNSIAEQELGVAQQSEQQSQQQYNQAQALQQPLIAQETALASGDRTAALTAAAPTISQIAGGYKGSQQSIMNTLPPGAARDTALAQLATQADTGIGSAQAAAVQQAPGVLASLGTQSGAFSLQELGAALSGYGGSSSANTQAAGLSSAQSAAKWAPITSLAGIAGGAAGSIFEGAGSRGGTGSGGGVSFTGAGIT